MAKPIETENHVINLIGVGTEITGDIKSNNDIRIDGTLNGNLNTQGKIVVGETGKIKGEITCKNSEVLGIIEGKIKVAELLSLKATARILGDIETKKLAIEPGSKFTGSCIMNEQTSINEQKIGNKVRDKERN
ncbi:MAG: polymer-forming cytoskeletal protein [Bacteroidales bacterium]|jgi:cytoskeletal protein CcmA (bactofilin family)|nr:polymer-forming cytoskeletal protein [Bacteroidales bacterium]